MCWYKNLQDYVYLYKYVCVKLQISYNVTGVSLITGLNWTGLDWTGLTQNSFSGFFSVGQKLNMLIRLCIRYSCLLSLLKRFPRVSRGQRSHAYLMSFNENSRRAFICAETKHQSFAEAYRKQKIIFLYHLRL